MPRAKNLKEAYNNFFVEPLKEEEEFRDFYVERPKSAPSPIEELRDRIDISDRKEKYLFLGFRGKTSNTTYRNFRDAIPFLSKTSPQLGITISTVSFNSFRCRVSRIILKYI